MAPIQIIQFFRLQAPLSSSRHTVGSPTPYHKSLSSPLVAEAWQQPLQTHPSPQFVQHILKGSVRGLGTSTANPPLPSVVQHILKSIQDVFRIGLDSQNSPSDRRTVPSLIYTYKRLLKAHSWPFSPSDCSAVLKGYWHEKTSWPQMTLFGI